MPEPPTGELTARLLSTEPGGLEEYAKECLAPLRDMNFPDYFLSVLRDHGVTRAEAVAGSGLEVHYAYQILNGTRNPGRDKILCLCIGGGLSLSETDRALERAAFGRLYPKRLRDAVIMLALSRRSRSVWKVNDLLAQYGEELLG